MDAIQGIEREYKKLATEIEYAVHRLEKSAPEGAASTIQDFKNVNKDIPRLLQELESVAATKQSISATIQGTLTRIGVHLQHLPAKALTGVPKEALSQFVELTAMPTTPAAKKTKRRTREEANEAEPSAQDNGRSTALTAEQLAQVPRSTRGRAKLADVNNVLTVIREETEKAAEARGRKRKGRGNPPAPVISRSQLDKRGAKVGGLTGQTILNVLRHMQYIDVTKEGVALR